MTNVLVQSSDYSFREKRDNVRGREWRRQEGEIMHIRKGTDSSNEAIHRMLQEYNAPYMKDGKDYSCYIEENGAIVAGLVAGSVCDTLEIDFLCVAEAYRGKGYGRQLLQEVEDKARGDRLRRILLNTYGFQAPEFYKKMGYRLLFKLDPAFGEYAQYYFIKDL